MRFLIEGRFADPEPRARSLERFGEERADVLLDDRLRRLAVALALADRAEHRRVALDAALHLITARIGDERIAVIARLDRKSVGSGKSVSVRVDLGGRRIIKKKKK